MDVIMILNTQCLEIIRRVIVTVFIQMVNIISSPYIIFWNWSIMRLVDFTIIFGAAINTHTAVPSSVREGGGANSWLSPLFILLPIHLFKFTERINTICQN